MTASNLFVTVQTEDAITINEPVTTLTDYLLALASAYFAISMARRIGPHNRTTGRLWTLGFGLTAIAAFLGGTFHGFEMQFLWNPTVFLIGAGAAFMVAGGLAASIQKSRKWLFTGIAVTAVAVGIQVTRFRQGLDFNHNDLFHVIQIAALYLFYRGATLQQDRR